MTSSETKQNFKLLTCNTMSLEVQTSVNVGTLRR